jgi:hypothetical protein
MSQIVLDDQLDVQILVPALAAWNLIRLQDLRPGEHVLDDRVPEILRTLHMPTFITIDRGFWDRRLCHPGYCLLYFQASKNEQKRLPRLLRRLLRLREFRSRAARMGKVARIRRDAVDYWKFGVMEVTKLSLSKR